MWTPHCVTRTNTVDFGWRSFARKELREKVETWIQHQVGPGWANIWLQCNHQLFCFIASIIFVVDLDKGKGRVCFSAQRCWPFGTVLTQHTEWTSTQCVLWRNCSITNWDWRYYRQSSRVLAGQTGAHEVVSYWGGVEPSVLHTGFLVNQLTNNENRKNSIEFFIFSLQLQSPKTSSTQPNSTTNLRVQY